MKCLFLGSFRELSTNWSQVESFEHEGFEVLRYDYRKRGYNLREITDIVHKFVPDIIFFSKCNGLHCSIVEECNKVGETVLWYMDPMNNFDQELIDKIRCATISCFALKEPYEQAKRYSKRVYFVHEGFDPKCDFVLPDIKPEYDVSFIGNMAHVNDDRTIYRKEIPFVNITDAYRSDHSTAVAKSKINLNFTAGGASDRVYKVLASKGFLLTQPWPGMEEDFTPGQDFVCFYSINDLRVKIRHYLDNEEDRRRIAEHGHRTVQKFNRIDFAGKILTCLKS